MSTLWYNAGCMMLIPYVRNPPGSSHQPPLFQVTDSREIHHVNSPVGKHHDLKVVPFNPDAVEDTKIKIHKQIHRCLHQRGSLRGSVILWDGSTYLRRGGHPWGMTGRYSSISVQHWARNF